MDSVTFREMNFCAFFMHEPRCWPKESPECQLRAKCLNITGPTRLELATSGVTGRRSNQLNYDPLVDRKILHAAIWTDNSYSRFSMWGQVPPLAKEGFGVGWSTPRHVC